MEHHNLYSINPKSLLYRLKEPADIKNCSINELQELSNDIRTFLMNSISQTGGHFSSNLGTVELTVALHYLLNSPSDKLIFDVGHQAYTHKILTGRLEHFATLRQKGGLSGFPRRSESSHDITCAGHASSGPSTALGLLTGDRLQNRANKVVCVIGDASIEGGMAFEALDHAGHLQKDLIIVLNDNGMSIDANIGALHNYLSNATAAKPYQQVRLGIERFFAVLPFGLGKALYALGVRCKKALKGMFFKETLFSDLGFEYAGPINGHDLKALIKALQNAMEIERPIVVHIITQKGKGYDKATDNPHQYHGVVPFRLEQGLIKDSKAKATFTSSFGDSLCRLASRDDKIVAITAAMGSGTGLSRFASTYPQRYYDVGIAEGHAVAFASGLAMSGLKPVVAIYSTFMQRAVDGVIHDLAIQGVGVVIVMDRSGFVPADGETHQGLYDIALFKSIPCIKFMAPATAFELDNMLRWALRQREPTLIRYPKEAIPPEEEACNAKIVEGQGVWVRQNAKSSILLISVGSMMAEALPALPLLQKEGLECSLYNLRFITPLDEQHLTAIMKRYDLVVVLEEAMKKGGVGETIAVMLHTLRRNIAFLHLAASPVHYGHATRPQLLKMAGLSASQIAKAIKGCYSQYKIRNKAEQLFKD